MVVSVRRFSGADAEPYLPELAKLRIEVFREFPYLYAGSDAYEQGYLRTYLGVPDSVIVVAFDGNRVVGASTALPMVAETDEVKMPLLQHDYNVSRVFYFGESVLKKPYRGKGLGVRFFEEREAYALSLRRFEWTAFCAVQRPDDHPRRPPDYVPLDQFWRNRGYEKYPQLTLTLSWQDLDETSESPKPMVFWLKHLKSVQPMPTE